MFAFYVKAGDEVEAFDTFKNFQWYYQTLILINFLHFVMHNISIGNISMKTLSFKIIYTDKVLDRVNTGNRDIFPFGIGGNI